jgi:protease IV
MPDQPPPPQGPPPKGRPPIDPSFSAPPPPPPPPPAPGYPQPFYGPPAKAPAGVASKVATSLIATLFVSSILLNIYFAIIVSQSVSLGPVVEQTLIEGVSEKRIAVLPLIGVINDDTAVFVRSAMQAMEDDLPAALVLRVDSGGGTVGASDRIWHYIDTFRKTYPEVKVVASYGSYAASGGYYVSAMADEIYAEPTCVTGSIGVMGQLFTVGGLLDKIGVEPITLVATDSPDKDRANDITRPWTEQDRQVVQVLLDSAYNRFVEVVAQGRSAVLTEQQVRELATGRIFTAKEAHEAKLVDEIGYLDDAINRAAQLAGLPAGEKPRVTIFGKHRSILDTLIGVSQTELPTFSTEQARAALMDLGVPRLDYMMMTR